MIAIGEILIAEMMRENPRGVSSKALAARLGLTLRTLQRRISRMGTSYRELYDNARRHRAFEMARDGARAKEVASALGFAGTPPFTRAFRRWSGMTFKAYRAASKCPPPAPDSTPIDIRQSEAN